MSTLLVGREVKNIRLEQVCALYFFEHINATEIICSVFNSSLDDLVCVAKCTMQQYLREHYHPVVKFLQYHAEVFQINSHGEVKLGPHNKALEYIQVGLPVKINEHNKSCETLESFFDDSGEDIINETYLMEDNETYLMGENSQKYERNNNIKDPILERLCIQYLKNILNERLEANTICSVFDCNIDDLFCEAKPNVQQYLRENYESVVDFLQRHSEVFKINSCGQIFPPIFLQDRAHVKKKLLKKMIELDESRKTS